MEVRIDHYSSRERSSSIYVNYWEPQAEPPTEPQASGRTTHGAVFPRGCQDTLVVVGATPTIVPAKSVVARTVTDMAGWGDPKEAPGETRPS